MKKIITIVILLAVSSLSYGQISNGIKAYWPLNGDATDISGNSNNGSISGTTTPTTDRNSISSGALYLDGNDYININAVVDDVGSNTAGTIALWVKPADATPSPTQQLISFGDTDNGTFLSVQINEFISGKLRISSEASWTGKYVLDANTSPFSDNTWTHVAIVQNATSVVAYVNGSAVGQSFYSVSDATAWFSTMSGIDNGRIGSLRKANEAESGYFVGSVDEVGVWNRALSSTEILSIYTNGIILTPTPPSTLVATATSNTSISLSWADNSSNETGFQIERSLTAGSGFTLVTTTAANAISYSNTGLTPGTPYYYRIRAINASGSSAYTAEATATTTNSGPASPTNLGATPTSTTAISLSWTDGSGDETGFQIERSLTSGTGFTLLTTTAANAVTYSNTGLTAGTTYYYRIRATNGAGNSAYTSQVSATTYPTIPATPSNLIATPVSSTSISLSWTDNSSGETGFRIERSLTPGTGFTFVVTTAANAVSYTNNTGLTQGTTYYYKIRSNSATGDSPFTSEVMTATLPTAPATPTGLTAITSSGTSIGLSWTDNSNNETGFQVERSLTSGSGFALVATTAANATSYNNTGLSAATVYYYRIRSTNTGGNSAYSATTNANTAAPSNLTASAQSASTVSLSWSDNSTTETAFLIERSLSATTGFAQIGSVAANSVAFIDPSPSPATTYYYRMRASLSSGNTNYSSVMSASTPLAIPIAPSNFTASAGAAGIINLAWTDNSTNETGFVIERSFTAGTGYSVLTTTASNAITFSNTTLPENTTYYYRIQATNSGGNSNYTTESSATTIIPLPAPPTDLIALPTTSSSIQVAWVDGATNETGYQIERSLTSASGFVLLTTTPPNSDSYVDPDLSGGTQYYYRVRAINTVGNSAYATEASATTPESVPGLPDAFVATTLSATSIHLSWVDTSNDETSFQIDRGLTPDGFITIANPIANATTFTDVGLSVGTMYYYRIKAVKNLISSGYTTANSSTQTTIPGAPSTLTATSTSSTTILLGWTDVSSNESGFHIERSTSAGTGFTQIAIAPANAVSYQDNSLNEGSTYFYRIRAANSAGTSAYTTEVSKLLTAEGISQFCDNIFCNPTGGVGIGTQIVPNGYRMSINGKMMAEGVKVALQSNWPDYVFGPNYKLQTIPDLKKYIASNGHLPNVPSAATVKAEGIDIEGVNIMLLEKIEEMSLYLIEMEERMNKLETENTKLKKNQSGKLK